ncbi:MAG: ATP phosphoribosyltransferase [Oligoflexus sp.]
MSEENLRIAMQKSGRLSEKCLALLCRAGVQFDIRKDRLFYKAKNQPVELMLVRDDDIPEYVHDGVCHLGIVGLNELEEKIGSEITNQTSNKQQVEIVRRLGFGHCRLSLAWPKDKAFEGLSSFQDMRIATSYPQILERFLKKNGVEASIVEISGSVEVAPTIGIADAVCDLVSTGGTLQSNGLREVITLLESEAVLVRNNKAFSPTQERFIKKILVRIDGVLKAQTAKYIMMNAPKEKLEQISRLIPGMEKPTIMPLMLDDSKVAIHAVAKEDIFWETMEQLKEAGATSILVMPIEKMIE